MNFFQSSLLFACLAAIAQAESLTIITYNLFAHKTLDKGFGATEYATKIKNLHADVVGAQEGVNDWKINSKFPTDYSRAQKLLSALGSCWQRRYQIFINTCKGVKFVGPEDGRWDLSDGEEATRTGETQVIEKNGNRFNLVNVHWEAWGKGASVRKKNADETADQVNTISGPTIITGDFNCGCSSTTASKFKNKATGVSLMEGPNIDCIFAKGIQKTSSQVFNGAPSDHHQLSVATFQISGSVSSPDKPEEYSYSPPTLVSSISSSQCTGARQDPWESGNGKVSCCSGLTEVLKDWDGNGR
eukprot:Pgem_evm1s9921